MGEEGRSCGSWSSAPVATIERDEVDDLALGIADGRGRLDPDGEPICVFRDDAFADDVAKTNLAAILRRRGVKIVRSL